RFRRVQGGQVRAAGPVSRAVPVAVPDGLLVAGGRRPRQIARTSAATSNAAATGPPARMTKPAPKFAPITPAVITRHPAPAITPAARSGAMTDHHLGSARRFRVAH